MRIPLLLLTLGLLTPQARAEELHHPRIQLYLSYPKDRGWRGDVQTNREPKWPDLVLMNEGKSKTLHVLTAARPSDALPFGAGELKQMEEYPRPLLPAFILVGPRQDAGNTRDAEFLRLEKQVWLDFRADSLIHVPSSRL